MVRRIGAVLAGVIVAFVLVALIEAIGHMVYPSPEGLDFTNSEAMAQFLSTMPIGAFIFLLAAWSLGTLGGGVLAGFIGKNSKLAYITGLILLLATIFNLVMIQHPLWVSIAGVLLIVLMAFLASKIVSCLNNKTHKYNLPRNSIRLG